MRSYSARCIARLKELGAPLSGWECVYVEDLEEACFTCELFWSLKNSPSTVTEHTHI